MAKCRHLWKQQGPEYKQGRVIYRQECQRCGKQLELSEIRSRIAGRVDSILRIRGRGNYVYEIGTNLSGREGGGELISICAPHGTFSFPRSDVASIIKLLKLQRRIQERVKKA